MDSFCCYHLIWKSDFQLGKNSPRAQEKIKLKTILFFKELKK